jgi:hypothetical protein
MMNKHIKAVTDAGKAPRKRYGRNEEIPNPETAAEIRHNRRIHREERRNRPAPEAIKAVAEGAGEAPRDTMSPMEYEMARSGLSRAITTRPFQYTETEKEAALIIDRLCPVFVHYTKAHIGPECFKALTIRLAELIDKPNAQLIEKNNTLLLALETIANQCGTFAVNKPALDYATIANIARAAVAQNDRE